MAQDKTIPSEETLDLEDWESMRSLGYRMVDDMLDYLKTLRERPAWQHAPDRVKAHFKRPLPLDPQPPEEIYKEFLENVLPYPVGNIHPRFWGWVFGSGTILGSFAEFLSASMNTNAGDLDHHSANHVEKQVIDWFKEMLGYPSSASGLLTSGCSAANFIALAVDRNAKAQYDVRREGINITLNIVCFRYIKSGLDDAGLNALNKKILVELQEQGIAVTSGTTIAEKYVLRIGHTNHRSRREDFDLLVREVIRIGQELAYDVRLNIPGGEKL